jgi:Ser/Thr protein kinase RdoA (MazF antagonist)
LGVAPVVRDLGGDDNLTVLVDSGRRVLRTYKPFVTRRRLVEIQRLRRTLAAAGLHVPVPERVGDVSLFRCGPRWAEIEPYVTLPSTGPFEAEALFRGLGWLHRALAGIPAMATHDLRRSFVSCSTLLRWVAVNVADGLIDAGRAGEIRRQLRRLNRRWVDPGGLPVQVIHTDPHAGNILATDSGDFVYLDFGGVESAPRIHDVAIAYMYVLSAAPGCPAAAADQLPTLLDAYAVGAHSTLTRREHEALPIYTAAVALYYEICDWAPGMNAVSGWLLDSIDT